ncbi:hypothetical protein SAMN02910298_01315 [Pseudobutyrivibrio sp. YE44]|uniref:hypothetical protein n=1 Tax=Pseudobutyrivibrio sp. YE44 TaxID=1520802 RepID=UPI0008813473|nr:hypothetical protein [Pseudobutyrivibrio sp. YE44]SDB25948.1 hypothetical protein SAMN02910298_01315 [Pseudobutyrivibrio sp. YE44]
MRNRKIQAMSMGLSALLLSSPVSLTAYAMEAEDEVDVKEEVQEQEIASSSETDVADDVSNLSEQLNNSGVSENLKDSAGEEALDGQYEQQVDDISKEETLAKDAVDSTCVSTDNVAKAAEAMENAVGQVDQATTDAGEVSSAVQETTSQAAVDAENAVIVVAQDSTTKTDAEVLIADTTKTVEEATTAFDSATEKYDQAMADYTAAKDDYDTALAAYNSNVATAKEEMVSANESLEAIQTKLQELEKQLSEARTELTDAGVDALLAAEDNKSADTVKYVTAVLENYYIPTTEELKEGQKISNFSSVTTDEEGLLQVSYDITDESGNVLRTVNANYGYVVDEATGQIQLYTKELTYQYNDVTGQPVVLNKEEAEKLNGKVEIDNTTYLPLFEYDGVYDSVRTMKTATRSSSVAAAQRLVQKSFTPDREEYKVDLTFNDDWNTSYKSAERQYETVGTYSAKVYSRLDKKFTDTGSPLWMDDSTDYTSYVSGARAKVTAYDNLIKSVVDAKNQYQAASEKVAEIQQRLDTLDNTGTVISMTNIIRLEMQLNSAKETYGLAKDNLEKAKNSLTEAKDIFTSRFAAKLNPGSQLQTEEESTSMVSGTYSLAQINTLEQDIEKELTEEVTEAPEVTEVTTVGRYARSNMVAQFDASNEADNSAISSGKDSSETKKKPSSVPKIVIEIPDEDTPLGITLSGLMERSRWFVGLAGVFVAGGGVAILEIKRHRAAKIIDKLNQ